MAYGGKGLAKSGRILNVAAYLLAKTDVLPTRWFHIQTRGRKGRRLTHITVIYSKA